MGKVKQQRRVQADMHGIADTQKTRYEDEWRRWRKQVRRYERVVSLFTMMFGCPRVRVRMPGTWQVDYENAELERHIPVRQLSGMNKSNGSSVQVSAGARDWYAVKAYRWHTTAWELRNGAMVLWSNGHEVTKRAPNMEIHEAFAREHGWSVDALKRTGHDEGHSDRAREAAVEEALAMVREGRVPLPERKRGRPRVTWLVLSEMGKRGVISCMFWKDRHERDEVIVRLLDGKYAREMRECVGG